MEILAPALVDTQPIIIGWCQPATHKYARGRGLPKRSGRERSGGRNDQRSRRIGWEAQRLEHATRLAKALLWINLRFLGDHNRNLAAA